jgi:hypothetical protein
MNSLPLLILLSLICTFDHIRCDTQTQITTGYIIAGCDGGLANRLRALVAYMHIAKVVYSAELVFVWDVNPACPGHFLEFFQPIEGVIFTTNSSRPVLSPLAKASFPNTRSHFEYIMMEFNIPKNRYGFISWWDIQTKNYAKFKPLQAIEKLAFRYIHENEICNASSMHLRQTDMNVILKPRQRASVESCDKFIWKRPDEEKVSYYYYYYLLS